jgi:hypothetical protein
MGRKVDPSQHPDFLAQLSNAEPILKDRLSLAPDGSFGVCVKPILPASDVEHLLSSLPSSQSANVLTDDLGCLWIRWENILVSQQVETIANSLKELSAESTKAKVLCAVFRFMPIIQPGEGTSYLVYLNDRQTFYPFCPTNENDRNSELELRIRTFLERELHIEKDLTRWMALWGLPI